MSRNIWRRLGLLSIVMAVFALIFTLTVNLGWQSFPPSWFLWLVVVALLIVCLNEVFSGLTKLALWPTMLCLGYGALTSAVIALAVGAIDWTLSLGGRTLCTIADCDLKSWFLRLLWAGIFFVVLSIVLGVSEDMEREKKDVVLEDAANLP